MPTPSKSAAAHAPGSEPVARGAALGWSGLVFVGVTVFLAIGAVNSQNNLLFWIFGIAISGVMISGIFSGAGLMGVRLEAHPVNDAETDAPTQLRYTLINTNRWLPVFAAVIREAAIHDAQPQAPGASIAHIPPGERLPVRLVWVPDCRGERTFDSVTIESRFPFGLLSKTLIFSSPRRVLVRPASVELAADLARSTRRSEAGDAQRRAKRGGTGAFFGLREYAPGDPRRTIAWKPSAKRGQLLVVEHAEPRRESVWIWLTKPTPQASAVDTERAIAIACSIARSSRGPVGVWMPWCGVRLFPAEGLAAHRRITTALSRANTDLPDSTDAPPPVHAGDQTIVIGATPAGSDPGQGNIHIDPAKPENWLARGASLPPSLREQQGGEHV